MLGCRSPPPRAIQDTVRHTPRYERTDSQDEEEKRGAVASKDGEKETPNLPAGQGGEGSQPLTAIRGPLYRSLAAVRGTCTDSKQQRDRRAGERGCGMKEWTGWLDVLTKEEH